MKIKKVFMVVIAAMLLVFLCAGLGGVALAEEETAPPEQTEEVAPDIEGVAEQFITYLKEKYGADYEFYYNQIIAQRRQAEVF